jgi:hypothetical protein
LALAAVEAGVRVTESDPNNLSVGFGGLPDRDGHVTLDAWLMNADGDCGAVAFLQHIENPISVARLVLKKTPRQVKNIARELIIFIVLSYYFQLSPFFQLYTLIGLFLIKHSQNKDGDSC